MSELKLPELPPRFRWNVSGSKGEVELEAFETEWTGGGRWEGIAYVYRRGNLYGTRIWKLSSKATGRWREMETVDSAEEGAKYIWTLVQLGEADFTFLNKEDEHERHPQ
jgi:hypothetical protein